MLKKPTILKSKFVWDGIAGKAIPEGAILIENGIINAIGPASGILTVSGATVIDFPDATLLPGLIDSHTHLSMDASKPDYLSLMTDSLPVLTLRATSMMRKDLMSGVTTCRCLGDREFLDIACRDAVSSGEVQGPRVLAATRGIRAPEGHGFVGYPFKGVEEVRQAVRENISRGADLIKIYITGTLKGKGNLPAYLAFEEIKTAIEEAHQGNKRVASHCVGGIGLDWAIELGLDTLEHAYHITPRQVERLANSKTALVLTPGAVLSEARVKNLPDHLIDGHIAEGRQMFESMASTIKAGIPFAVGTDGMHGDLAGDILYLSRLGATNLQALQAATLHGAIVCGLADKTGSLRKGNYADIIAVEGNPLDDLAALRKIRCVIKEGDLVFSISGKVAHTEHHADGIM